MLLGRLDYLHRLGKSRGLEKIRQEVASLVFYSKVIRRVTSVPSAERIQDELAAPEEGFSCWKKGQKGQGHKGQWRAAAEAKASQGPCQIPIPTMPARHSHRATRTESVTGIGVASIAGSAYRVLTISR